MAVMTWRRYHGGRSDRLRRDPGCGDGDACGLFVDLDFASIGEVKSLAKLIELASEQFAREIETEGH